MHLASSEDALHGFPPDMEGHGDPEGRGPGGQTMLRAGSFRPACTQDPQATGEDMGRRGGIPFLRRVPASWGQAALRQVHSAGRRVLGASVTRRDADEALPQPQPAPGDSHGALPSSERPCSAMFAFLRIAVCVAFPCFSWHQADSEKFWKKSNFGQ